MKKSFLALLCLLFSASMWAQQQKKDSTTQKKKKIEFTFVPYLSYNRNLEFMFGAVPMAMYRLNPKDTISPKSLTGASAVYTTNKSFFVVGFGRWYFKEDTWRLQAYAGAGDRNSQFFMEDEINSGFYDYATNMTFFSVGLKRKIGHKLYAGLSFAYTDYDTDYYGVSEPTSQATYALEPNLLSDTRDNVYYPTTGHVAKLRWQTFQKWIGNDVTANRVYVEYNKYWSTRENSDVIAARASATMGLGDIAFEQQKVLGGKDIRGYSEGKYRGDGLIALQGEYRYNFAERMGVVGYAGLATIYGSDTDSFDWNLYPGIGAGYRYKAFKDSPFTVGLDGALGKDDWGVYFRIGEAF